MTCNGNLGRGARWTRERSWGLPDWNARSRIRVWSRTGDGPGDGVRSGRAEPMTESAIDAEPLRGAVASANLTGAMRRLGREAARLAYAKLDAWQRQVNGEEPGSVTDRAVVAALRTGLPGPGKGDPARAALSTVWNETTPAGRAALIGVLLLLIAAAPVLMLVTLLLAALAAVALRLGRRRLAAA